VRKAGGGMEAWRGAGERGVWLPLVAGSALLPPLETGEAGVKVPLPHLLLQVEDHVHGVVHDSQLGHGFVSLHVRTAYPPELLEGVVDVPNAHSLPLIVAPAPLLVFLVLLLGVQGLVLGVLCVLRLSDLFASRSAPGALGEVGAAGGLLQGGRGEEGTPRVLVGWHLKLLEGRAGGTARVRVGV